jgi:hypothetical protein
MKVRLETAQGEFVGNAILPPFSTPPPVVFWGVRVFALHEEVPLPELDSEEDKAEEAAIRLGVAPIEAVYRESWMFAVDGVTDS